MANFATLVQMEGTVEEQEGLDMLFYSKYLRKMGILVNFSCPNTHRGCRMEGEGASSLWGGRQGWGRPPISLGGQLFLIKLDELIAGTLSPFLLPGIHTTTSDNSMDVSEE